MNFKEIKPEKITENPFDLINNQWMLISTGQKKIYNMMTASWGGMGVVWNKKVCYIYVRPSRYTYEFLEENKNFSLNFFSNEKKDILNLCGTKSGRIIDKMNISGLSPIEDKNSIYFNEAKMVFICKIIAYHDILSVQLLEPEIEKNYPKGDYHRMYTGEIIKCLIKNS